MPFIKTLLGLLLNIVLIILILAFNLVLLPFRVIKGIYRWFFPKPEAEVLEGELPDGRNIEASLNKKNGPLNVNLDNLDDEEQEDFRAAIAEQTDLTVYKKKVKHAYDLKTVSQKDLCPRCQAPTEQQYANFLYSVPQGIRVMFAPAGYFCTKCPTVIVDQKLIKAGVTRGFKYYCVVGLDYGDKNKPGFFETWNGEKTVFVIDEDESIVEIASPREFPDGIPYRQMLQPSHRDREKARRREKLAKEARKKNRRKKK